VTFPEFRVNPDNLNSAPDQDNRVQADDVGRASALNFQGIATRDECRNCPEGRLRGGRHPRFSRGVATLGNVLKAVAILLWLLAVLTSIPKAINAQMQREKTQFLIGFAYVTLLIVVPIWVVGWGLSRRSLRYRCEQCGNSISKKEYLARSNEKHDVVS